MDSILDNLYIITDSESEEQTNEVEVSLWLSEDDIIRPSHNLKISKTLTPGMYETGEDRNGLFCRPIDVDSDSLFKFSNDINSKLFEEIETFWNKKELYKANDLVHKRGILLTGLPGTGKSSIITMLSNQIINKGGVVFKISSVNNFIGYIEFIKNYFRKIEPNTPVITIIEDIDVYNPVESTLLDFLDGKSQIENHVIIATSNDTSDMSDAYFRPGRLDLFVEIPLPDDTTRREYFENKKVPSDLIEEFVKVSEEMSIAELKELYVSVLILDYSIEDSVNKIFSPKSKQNFLLSKSRGSLL